MMATVTVTCTAQVSLTTVNQDHLEWVRACSRLPDPARGIYHSNCHQSVREAISYRGLFTAGWFGVREKHCSRLKIYDRLRANEHAAYLTRPSSDPTRAHARSPGPRTAQVARGTQTSPFPQLPGFESFQGLVTHHRSARGAGTASPKRSRRRDAGRRTDSSAAARAAVRHRSHLTSSHPTRLARWCSPVGLMRSTGQVRRWPPLIL